MGLYHEPSKFSISWEREKCKKETQNNPVSLLLGVRGNSASFQVSVIIPWNNNVAFLYSLHCWFPAQRQTVFHLAQYTTEVCGLNTEQNRRQKHNGTPVQIKKQKQKITS